MKEFLLALLILQCIQTPFVVKIWIALDLMERRSRGKQ